MIVDTHVIVWTIWDKWRRFGPKTRQLLLSKELDIVVSAASLMEIKLKQRRDKLKEYSMESILTALQTSNTPVLNIKPEHITFVVGKNVTPHADPFDLLLMAQAISEGLPLLTCDNAILKVAYPGLRLIDGRN